MISTVHSDKEEYQMEEKKVARFYSRWSLILTSCPSRCPCSLSRVATNSARLPRCINSGVNYATTSCVTSGRKASRERLFLLVAVSATRPRLRFAALVRARICIRSEFNVLRFGVHAHRWRHSRARARERTSMRASMHLEHAYACTYARERPRRIR